MTKNVVNEADSYFNGVETRFYLLNDGTLVSLQIEEWPDEEKIKEIFQDE